jgi:diguanylate cyclase (GGDEF)-like protein
LRAVRCRAARSGLEGALLRATSKLSLLWRRQSGLGAMIGLRSARGRAILAGAVLLLLLIGMAALAVWRAENDRDVRRSLEQRSAVVAALSDARAEFFLGATFMAMTIFAEDKASFIDMYHQAKVAGDESTERARAELVALGDTEGLASLDAFITGGDDMDAAINAFSEYLLVAPKETVIQAGQAYMADQWPEADSLVAGLDDLASEQQAKLAAERAAADDAARTALAWVIAFSIFAFLTGVVALMALSLSVVSPLASLRTSVRAITSGNLEARASVSGPQEVASLARDFNEMITARRAAGEALREARDELEVRVEERTAALAAANEELDRLARTDALTGLANHRYGNASLEGAIQRARLRGEQLSVLIGDVDDFKLFNDTYGHALGDEVLRLVAGVLREKIGDSGTASRYGGDEFLVILPGVDKAGAEVFADRLAAAVGETEFQVEDGSRVPVGLSLGVASFPEDSESKDHLLALADAAMYEAKRLGETGREAPRVMAVGAAAFESAFGALESLVQAVQYRDRYTKTHSDMVAEYAAKLGLRAGLSEEAARALRIAGALHDIGKIIVPDEILKKPGPLTAEEYDVIKRHPSVGETLIRETPFLEDVIQAVGCHHECYDGSGYPRGLRGEEIPLPARVMAVADAYSAMCLDRPYRKALSLDRVIAELRAGAGTKFEPRLVDIFIEMLEAERQAKAA